MRKITEKDKRGLLVAVRVFLRAMNGERISQQAGMPVIDKALEKGLTFDELLNKGNWERASEICPGMSFKDYVDILVDKKIEVRSLTEEPMWFEPSYGFTIVAEAAHDFFMEVSNRGGKWNIPSALTNLAKIIRNHSLQSVMSDELILKVIKEKDTNYFGYILAVAEDFNSLPVEDELTEEQMQRRHDSLMEQDDLPPGDNEGTGLNPLDPEEMPEDEPFPEEFMDIEPPANEFETAVITQGNPNDSKKSALRTVLGNYTPKELMGLVATIEDGEDLTVDEIFNRLVDGRFNVELEDEKTKEIHRDINTDLMPSFITCVTVQGREMNEEMAAECDILHESWDMRSPDIRKLHKLLKLIYTEGKDDPDLLASVKDIEEMYTGK